MKKFKLFIVFSALMLIISAYAYSQANCTLNDRWYDPASGTRTSHYSCSDGNYVTISVYQGGSWVPIYNKKSRRITIIKLR